MNPIDLAKEKKEDSENLIENTKQTLEPVPEQQVDSKTENYNEVEATKTNLPTLD